MTRLINISVGRKSVQEMQIDKASATVTQDIQHSAAEHKVVDSIPGHGSCISMEQNARMLMYRST